MRIFISHSSKDVGFVSLLTDLLIDALPISKSDIRCTSVPGFKLSVGVHTSQELRKELDECQVIIGVLTSSSLVSSYVLFELGAGWGLQKTVFPIIGPGAKFPDIRPPLSEIHSIQYTDLNDLHRFIEDLAKKLQTSPREASSFSARLITLATFKDPQ